MSTKMGETGTLRDSRHPNLPMWLFQSCQVMKEEYMFICLQVLIMATMSATNMVSTSFPEL